MEHKASAARNDLAQMLLDETAEPKALPLSLLQDITGDFSDDQEIGSGGFAVVYKGIHGDRAVAVKRLSKAYMHEAEFHREVECLMRVKHKNVVRFLGYCADTQGNMERYNGKLVMADVHQRLLCFEYIPKGGLDKYIIDAYREWGTCYKIIKGICEGLQYLHENHIIHLDLKPANILLDNNMVPKITDFGLSRCFEENQSWDITKTILGTMGYLAPEFRDGGVIARGADLYSLGVVIIEILTGQKGYQPIGDVLESWSDKLERSQRDKLRQEIRVCYETALECRDFNPAKRPSARDIIDRLHEMESIQSCSTFKGAEGDGARRDRASSGGAIGRGASTFMDGSRLRFDKNPEAIISREQPKNFSRLRHEDLRAYLQSQQQPAHVGNQQQIALLREAMSTPVLTATEEQTLEEVESHFETVSGFPVVDSTLRCVGVVVKRDRARALHGSKTKIAEVMTCPAITLASDKTVTDAATLMLKKKIHRLPIVNQDNQVIGIVTRNDALRVLEATLKI